MTVTTDQTELLIDGKKVSVIVAQYSTDPRYHVEFITGDSIYVKIYVYPEDCDRGILNELSFVKESINIP